MGVLCGPPQRRGMQGVGVWGRPEDTVMVPESVRGNTGVGG